MLENEKPQLRHYALALQRAWESDKRLMKLNKCLNAHNTLCKVLEYDGVVSVQSDDGRHHGLVFPDGTYWYTRDLGDHYAVDHNELDPQKLPLSEWFSF